MITPLENNFPIKASFLGEQEYVKACEEMRKFTDSRLSDTPDQLWILEHPSVYTLGQAGKPEHILNQANIPVVKSDRGGQVTYHGPGQLVAYPLVNLRRLSLNVRELVSRIEQSVVQFLAAYTISSDTRADAPGVYVEGCKIASLGLRVRKGHSFHGVAINIDADLQPFENINPCGYPGMRMARLADLVHRPLSVADVAAEYAGILASQLGLKLEMTSAVPPWATKDSTNMSS